MRLWEVRILHSFYSFTSSRRRVSWLWSWRQTLPAPSIFSMVLCRWKPHRSARKHLPCARWHTQQPKSKVSPRPPIYSPAHLLHLVFAQPSCTIKKKKACRNRLPANLTIPNKFRPVLVPAQSFQFPAICALLTQSSGVHSTVLEKPRQSPGWQHFIVCLTFDPARLITIIVKYITH